MTPGSFDAVTARELTGDARARHIEAQAREHADAADLDSPGATYAPPRCDGTTYWDGVRACADHATYHEAFQRRIERRRRKQAAGNLQA